MYPLLLILNDTKLLRLLSRYKVIVLYNHTVLWYHLILNMCYHKVTDKSIKSLMYPLLYCYIVINEYFYPFCFILSIYNCLFIFSNFKFYYVHVIPLSWFIPTLFSNVNYSTFFFASPCLNTSSLIGWSDCRLLIKH